MTDPDKTVDRPTTAAGVLLLPTQSDAPRWGNQPPSHIGRFEVRAVLGEGAFGRVYRGFDPELRRDVAIKVPHLAGLTDEFRERFLREARATATIYHANVCPVHEVGTDGAVPFIVMHYVPGTTLAALLKKQNGPVPVRNALTIVRKLALGMAAAHAKGVIHRDLKPANVLYDAASREVLLTDFGLARIGGESQLTAKDSFLGTPAYMSPEQAEQKADKVGPLSDVYSLGVILYEMLAGRVPFTGTVMEVAIAHCVTAPQPPSALRTELDPKLDAICLRALAKKPSDRYRSAKELAEVLTEYLRTSEPAGGTAALPTFTDLPGPAAPAPHEPAAETVSEKAAKTTAPAFEIVPPAHKSAVVEVVEDEEDEPAAQEPRKHGKKKRRAHRRSGGSESALAKAVRNPIAWAALALVLVGGVVLGVLAARGKRAPDTAQQPAPAEQPAASPKQQPAPAQPQPQPALQPQPQPKLPVVAGPTPEQLRARLADRWKFVSGLGLDADIKKLDGLKVYLYMEFNPDGTARIGTDSFDPEVHTALAKNKEAQPIGMKYRVTAGDQIEVYDIPQAGQTGMFGTKSGASKVGVKFQGDTLTFSHADGTTSTLVRVLARPR